MLFVSIMTFCSIDRVQVNKAYAAGVNLALKKEAYASGKYNDTPNYAPDKINDGNYSTLWSDGQVDYTGTLGGYYYIAVDLADYYIINKVIAYPRIDFDDSAMLHNWYIQLANERDFSDAVTVAHIESKCEFGGNFVFDVDQEESYRYVRIASPKAYFTCGELEVFGEKYDPHVMSGDHNFIDSQNRPYNAAAVVCDALGIIKATGKASFEGEKMMTRAAATEALVTMMNYEVDENEESIFEDVSEDHYAKAYIMAGYRNNLIAKSEKFRPDEYITQGELCKMIIYAFGYGEDAKSYTDWRVGISGVSSSLKLLKSVETKFDDKLNRGTAAQIIYNALKAPLNNVEFGETSGVLVATKVPALYSLYKMSIVEGIMTENSASKLTHPTEKRQGRAVIAGNVYEDEGGLMQRMLGKSVGVLVNEDNDVITGYENTQINRITRVYDSSFVSASNGAYMYIEEGKERVKRIKFDEQEVYVIRNYAAIPDWTYADLEPEDGYIDFIDNDKDGDIEIISIMKPDIVIGGYVLPLAGDVSVVGYDGSRVAINEPVWTRFMRNGSVTTPGRYEQNDVIFVYKSENDAILFIDGHTKSVSGTVTAIRDEYASIDNVQYELSEYYKEMVRTDAFAKRDSLMQLGEECIVLMDAKNRIICAVNESIKAKADIIGFVSKIYGDDIEGTCRMRVFNEKGKFVTYNLAEKVNIDDRRIKIWDLIEDIDTVKANIKDKMIKFRVNDAEEITQIDVLEDSGIVLGNNSVYINNGYGVYSKGWMVQPLMPDTLCFTLPRSGSEYVYDGYAQYYMADKVSDHMLELDQIEEKWTFYDVDDLGFPSVAVRYKEVAAFGQELRAVNSSGHVDGLIVQSIAEYYDEESGEQGYSIKGLDMSGNQKTLLLDASIIDIFKADDLQGDKFEDSDSDPFNTYKDIIVENLSVEDMKKYTMPVEKLKAGDLIRYEVTDGVVSAVERTFDAYSGKDGVYERPVDGTYYSAGRMYPQFPDAEYRLVYGKALEIVNDTFIMSTCERETGKGALTQYVQYAKIEKIIVCRGKQFEIYDGNVLPAYIKTNQEVLLFTSDRAKPTCLRLYE